MVGESDKAAITAVARRYQHLENYQIIISGDRKPSPDYLNDMQTKYTYLLYL
jgi:hypothetical protein